MELSLNPPLVSQCNSIISIVQHDNAINDSDMSCFQQTFTLLLCDRAAVSWFKRSLRDAGGYSRQTKGFTNRTGNEFDMA